jgi:hypothetical protein
LAVDVIGVGQAADHKIYGNVVVKLVFGMLESQKVVS